MMRVRPVRPEDLGELLRLAALAGKGMTSLPSCAEAMAAKIALSQASFTSEDASDDDLFFLALEDTGGGRLLGTASIHARTGARQAFYAYRVMPLTHYSHSLNTQVRSELLHLSNDYTDCSEVASLLVDPAGRGNGHWLAASRYLLMGQFPERFASCVIAELRGVIDEDGISPFWEAIGRHFFAMDYAAADALCGKGSNQFITELMPKYPIYTRLLPASARAVIGQPHHASRRALDFLEAEGFRYDNVVDIFDGGPILRGRIAELRSVAGARQNPAQPMKGSGQGTAIVATTTLARFCALRSDYALDEAGRLCLPAATLAALGAEAGEILRWLPEGAQP